MATAAVDKAPRERKMSTHAPISTMQGPVGPGFTRPKHKRTGRCEELPTGLMRGLTFPTVTGFGAGEIKAVESSIPEHMREAWRKFVG